MVEKHWNTVVWQFNAALFCRPSFSLSLSLSLTLSLSLSLTS